MKKKIIIELNGVIFEPIDKKFQQIAIDEYGQARGRLVTLAYKYGIGRRFFADQVNNVFYKCASNPSLRDGAISALTKITQLPNVSVELCSKISDQALAEKLEEAYRAIAPCMDKNIHYELISPYNSKRKYISKTTAQNEDTMNYVLDSTVRHLDWPSRWRIAPVLVGADSRERNATMTRATTARVFPSLEMFSDYIAHKR